MEEKTVRPFKLHGKIHTTTSNDEHENPHSSILTKIDILSKNVEILEKNISDKNLLLLSIQNQLSETKSLISQTNTDEINLKINDLQKKLSQFVNTTEIDEIKLQLISLTEKNNINKLNCELSNYIEEVKNQKSKNEILENELQNIHIDISDFVKLDQLNKIITQINNLEEKYSSINKNLNNIPIEQIEKTINEKIEFVKTLIDNNDALLKNIENVKKNNVLIQNLDTKLNSIMEQIITPDYLNKIIDSKITDIIENFKQKNDLIISEINQKINKIIPIDIIDTKIIKIFNETFNTKQIKNIINETLIETTNIEQFNKIIDEKFNNFIKIISEKTNSKNEIIPEVLNTKINETFNKTIDVNKIKDIVNEVFTNLTSLNKIINTDQVNKIIDDKFNNFIEKLKENSNDSIPLEVIESKIGEAFDKTLKVDQINKIVDDKFNYIMEILPEKLKENLNDSIPLEVIESKIGEAFNKTLKVDQINKIVDDKFNDIMEILPEKLKENLNDSIPLEVIESKINESFDKTLKVEQVNKIVNDKFNDIMEILPEKLKENSNESIPLEVIESKIGEAFDKTLKVEQVNKIVNESFDKTLKVEQVNKIVNESFDKTLKVEQVNKLVNDKFNNIMEILPENLNESVPLEVIESKINDAFSKTLNINKINEIIDTKIKNIDKNDYLIEQIEKMKKEFIPKEIINKNFDDLINKTTIKMEQINKVINDKINEFEKKIIDIKNQIINIPKDKTLLEVIEKQINDKNIKMDQIDEKLIKMYDFIEQKIKIVPKTEDIEDKFNKLKLILFDILNVELSNIKKQLNSNEDFIKKINQKETKKITMEIVDKRITEIFNKTIKIEDVNILITQYFSQKISEFENNLDAILTDKFLTIDEFEKTIDEINNINSLKYISNDKFQQFLDKLDKIENNKYVTQTNLETINIIIEQLKSIVLSYPNELNQTKKDIEESFNSKFITNDELEEVKNEIIKNNTTKINSLENIKNEIEQLCKFYSFDNSQNIDKEIKKTNNELANYYNKVNEIEQKLVDLNKHVDELQQNKKNAENFEDLSKTITIINNQIDELKKNNIKSNDVSLEKIKENIFIEINEIKNKIIELTSKFENPKIINEKLMELEEFKKSLNETNTLELKNINNKINELKFVKYEDINNINEKITKSFKDETSELRKTLNILDYRTTIELESIKEKITDVVKNNNVESNPINSTNKNVIGQNEIIEKKIQLIEDEIKKLTTDVLKNLKNDIVIEEDGKMNEMKKDLELLLPMRQRLFNAFTLGIEKKKHQNIAYNISINGSDGALIFTDLPEITTEKSGIGKYVIHLNDKLNRDPVVVYVSVVNPEYIMVSYQLIEVSKKEIKLVTYKFNDGAPINVNRVFIQFK